MKSALLLLAILAIPAASQAARLGGTPVALVTAETQNRLIAVELPSGRILRRLPMPTDPENVEVDPGFGLGPATAVVVSARGRAVTLVDARRLRTVKVLHGFGSPHIPLIVPAHQIAYVTDDARGQLAVIDLVHRRVVRKVFVGYGAHHMAISPDWSRLWVALGERARSITVVDTSSPGAPSVIGHVAPGGAAHDLGFSPDGTRVWVTYDDRSSVAIFDARTRRRLRALPAGAPPQHVAFDQYAAAGRAYLTSGDDGTLRIVSLRNLRTLRTLSVARGSFNVSANGLVLTSSLTNGMLTELDENGHLLLKKRVAPAARDVAQAVLP
jgi:DNA-binding beta-propeller fold protein YncE